MLQRVPRRLPLLPTVTMSPSEGSGRSTRSPAPTVDTTISTAASTAAVFDGVFATLAAWRTELVPVLTASESLTVIDEHVAELVLPALVVDDPLLIGAGFIAAPFDDDAADVRGPGFDRHSAHFAWWLGPLDAGPIFGSTTMPTRLDLSTRGYADYLRDVRTLEWYRVPAATGERHVTGPYVDHLCTCDYILTVTMPVEVAGRFAGVVGVDIAVRRLERELLPLYLASATPLALVNGAGRVVLSTEQATPAGTLVALPATAGVSGGSALCPGTPFQVIDGPTASARQ
ncbi:cache domain-containing protein [Rathayibacter soli]|uniref:cache domain-containing protein n=1 Tax=Rathayibacter soli TaxID=3144168 RepID=UPI0027E3F65D|nr:cache domain-containing protein [Glaciibacter superstes]